ncbi:MAG: hypothetical protein LBK25_04170 [Treponema sp.]|nr:hypothetical protein [Treponema sp.]
MSYLTGFGVRHVSRLTGLVSDTRAISQALVSDTPNLLRKTLIQVAKRS